MKKHDRRGGGLLEKVLLRLENKNRKRRHDHRKRSDHDQQNYEARAADAIPLAVFALPFWPSTLHTIRACGSGLGRRGTLANHAGEVATFLLSAKR
jgi:hypothetical protein